MRNRRCQFLLIKCIHQFSMIDHVRKYVDSIIRSTFRNQEQRRYTLWSYNITFGDLFIRKLCINIQELYFVEVIDVIHIVGCLEFLSHQCSGLLFNIKNGLIEDQLQ